MTAAPSSSGGAAGRRRIPAYLLSILALFAVPVAALGAAIRRDVPAKPFFASIGVISVIGWIWSAVVSYNGWWTFGEHTMLGWHVVPYLPFEEFLFYPLGGAFSILVYVWITKRWNWTHGALYWAYLAAGSLGFGILAITTAANGPYYLYSQFVVFNGLCGVALAPFVARRINLWGAWAPVLVLGVVGYLWDHVAFTRGWWAYHAIAGLHVGIVPVDDFNFFLYAPPAACSIYLLVCRRFGSPTVLRR